MSSIVSTDTVIRIPPGEAPDYNSDNPLVRLLATPKPSGSPPGGTII